MKAALKGIFYVIATLVSFSTQNTCVNDSFKMYTANKCRLHSQELQDSRTLSFGSIYGDSRVQKISVNFLTFFFII